MRDQTIPSRTLVLALTILLILVSSKVSECHRVGSLFGGIQLDTLRLRCMFESLGFGSSSTAHSPAPAPAPAPAPGPSFTRRPRFVAPPPGPSGASAPSPGPVSPSTPSPGPLGPSAASSEPLDQIAPSPSPGPMGTSSPSPEPLDQVAPSPSVDPISGLQVGFYKGRCSNETLDVEELIAAKVAQEFRKDPTILPALLRLQFHDCFVHGCDASILIDGPSTEKEAGPNLSVRGYEFIEAVKASMEEQCPGIVSCADIVAIATQVVIKLGGGPDYPVQTGRRDGIVSNAQDVILPSPFITVPASIEAFGAKNLTAEEMVVLLGCHAVGTTRCGFFQLRLYESSSQFDPNMDPTLRNELVQTCPQNPFTNNSTLLNQDRQNNNTVDNSFFGQLMKNRGILPIDQALARDPATNGTVLELSQNGTLFNQKLAKAMVKLQALEVLTGNQGQIRKVCSKVN